MILVVPTGYTIIKIKKRIPKEMTGESMGVRPLDGLLRGFDNHFPLILNPPNPPTLNPPNIVPICNEGEVLLLGGGGGLVLGGKD